MANAPKKPSVKQQKKQSNNLYKKGKLSKNARFNPKRVNWTPIIVLACVIATFIFAVIFGNILGKRAEESQNTTPSVNDPSSLTPPRADKVEPFNELHAYFADMTGADPEKSLSNQTQTARNRGNALFIDLKNDKNEIIYSSDKTGELNVDCADNLALSRLSNHLEYYDDYTVGIFKSDFNAGLDTESAFKLQNDEILLLKEACDTAFDQMIISFDGKFTRDTLIHYQAYLLNLKLACPNTPIGITLSREFLSDPDNAGTVASILDIADFFVLDLSGRDAETIENALAHLVYFTERYDSVVMISDAEGESLSSAIATLEENGIKNYIVR